MPQKDTEELLHSLNGAKSLTEYLVQNEEEMISSDLTQLLADLIKQKNIRKTELVKATGLSEVYIYEILSGRKRPQRNCLLQICFALQMTQEEVQQLLKQSGYPLLYPRRRRDSVILYALEKQMTLAEAEELLIRYGMEGIIK